MDALGSGEQKAQPCLLQQLAFRAVSSRARSGFCVSHLMGHGRACLPCVLCLPSVCLLEVLWGHWKQLQLTLAMSFTPPSSLAARGDLERQFCGCLSEPPRIPAPPDKPPAHKTRVGRSSHRAPPHWALLTIQRLRLSHCPDRPAPSDVGQAKAVRTPTLTPHTGGHDCHQVAVGGA